MKVYKLGVIGDPVEHSLSPKIHNFFAKRANINIDYKAYHVLPQDLNSFIKDFFKSGGDGLNVTLPHKVTCLNSAGSTSSLVTIIGAANTLEYIKSSKKIIAESTDGRGLVDDLLEKFNLRSANILILGAGGAALSIIPDLERLLPANIVLDNRSKEKIQPIIERFSPFLHNTKIVNIDNFSDAIDLVINATSAGFSGPFQWGRELNLNKTTIFYDLSYTNSKEKTPFLEWASQYSDNYHDGFGMLINQAALSFRLWTGIKPDTKILKYELFND